MTHRSDDQSYEDTLDDAVRDMHQEMPRGNQPSGRAWNIFAAEAGIPNEYAADNQPSFHPSIAKDGPAATRMTKGASSTQPGSHLGWSTWLAVALVLVVVGASANFLMPENNDNNTSEHSIALAPGTPDMSVFPQLQVATPFASPGAYLPEYGPEFACHAEPLTEDQVFDIVINPLREHARRGSETQGPGLDRPREDYSWFTNQVHSFYTNELFLTVDDVELAQQLRDISDDFWNCLMTGSAFQVWSLMDPANVQQEVLAHYPVLRDESVLREHIRLWGDQPYKSGLKITFPDLEQWETVDAAMTADTSSSAVIIMPSPFESQEHARARVTMIPHPEGTRWTNLYVQLEFVRAADGTWWATKVIFDAR